QVRGHAHREVAAAFQDKEVMIETDAGNVDQVVTEMQGLRGRPPLAQPRNDVRLVTILGERPPHQEAYPHHSLPWPLRRVGPGQTMYQPRNDSVTRACPSQSAGHAQRDAAATPHDAVAIQCARSRRRRELGRSDLLRPLLLYVTWITLLCSLVAAFSRPPAVPSPPPRWATASCV